VVTARKKYLGRNETRKKNCGNGNGKEERRIQRVGNRKVEKETEENRSTSWAQPSWHGGRLLLPIFSSSLGAGGSLAIYLHAGTCVCSRNLTTSINKKCHLPATCGYAAGRQNRARDDRSVPSAVPSLGWAVGTPAGVGSDRLRNGAWAAIQQPCCADWLSAQCKQSVPNWNPVLRGNLGGRQDGRTGTQVRAGVGGVAWEEKEEIDEIDLGCTKKESGPSLSDSLAHSTRISGRDTRGTKNVRVHRQPGRVPAKLGCGAVNRRLVGCHAAGG
jgi:hypothetical protein